MTLLEYEFVKREGKFYRPIVSKKANRVVMGGQIVDDPTGKETILSGIKGNYAKMRLRIPAVDAVNKVELFAINSEFYISSN